MANQKKVMTWIGWVLTVLVCGMLTMSAMMKLTKSPQAVEGLAHFGYPENTLIPIGVTEVACMLLFLIPRTSVLGAILVTGYLGGAVATHVRAGELFVIPVVLGVVAWFALFLRDPRIRALLPVRRSVSSHVPY